MAGIDGAANENQDENQYRAENPNTTPPHVPVVNADGGPDLTQLGAAAGPYSSALPLPPYAPPPAMSSAKDGDDVAVNLDDLRSYRGRITAFQGYVSDIYRILDDAGDIRPGTFPAAGRMANSVNEEGGLTPSTKSFLFSVADSFGSIGSRLNNVITIYEEAEDANKVTAQQIGDEFNEGFGMIEGLGGDGPSATT